MNKTVEQYLIEAHNLENKSQYQKAIDRYQDALTISEDPKSNIQIHNRLGQIFNHLGKTQEAIKEFKYSIHLHDQLVETESEIVLPNKAVVYNHLGTLYAKFDITQGIAFHQQASKIFNDLNIRFPLTYIEQLANTHYLLGGAYMIKGDQFQAFKSYKAVSQLYGPLEYEASNGIKSILAYSYAQLGDLSSEKDEIQEARSYYHKAIKLYEKLTDQYPDDFRPFLASVKNNLGVVNRLEGYKTEAITYFKQATQDYKILVGTDPKKYLPYYAASLMGLGNIHADSWTPEDDIFAANRGFLSGFGVLKKEETNENLQNLAEAENYYFQAVEIYQKLQKEEPGHFTHYLASVLHNLGVLYDENRSYKKAEKYYLQAIDWRKKLVEQQPEAFDFDLSSSQMNLVTLYQTLMEKNVDISYKDISLQILRDTQKRLNKYEDNVLPKSIENIKGEIVYFIDYFKEISFDKLTSNHLKIKAGELYENSMSNLDDERKVNGFKDIIGLYKTEMDRFPKNLALSSDLFHFINEACQYFIEKEQLNLALDLMDNETIKNLKGENWNDLRRSVST